MGSSFNINNHCSITSETLHGAMDQHAMNIAILFSKWVNVNAVRNGFDQWTIGCGMETKEYTSEQLYKIFLNQLTNGNNKDNTLPRPDAETV